mgnify:CR=1 FL=1
MTNYIRETACGYECQRIDENSYSRLEQKKNEIREENAKTKLLTHPGRRLQESIDKGK